jgi:hypothetical protein
MLKNRQVLLAKLEATYNVDPVPVAATNSILVEDLKWALEGHRRAARPAIRASLGKLKDLYAGSLLSVSFTTEVKGAGGAVDVPPEISPLFQAAGWKETINVATSVVYTPASTTLKSITLYPHEDGVLYKVTGCVGTSSGSFKTADKGMLTWNFKGHYSGPTDVALPTPTYNATVPVPLINVPFSVDSFSGIISSLSFDLGVEIAMPDSIAATDGYGQLQITGRNVTGSIDPEMNLAAAYDWLNKLRLGTAFALTTGVIGTATGNKYKIDMPAITYTDVSPGDRSGILTRDVKFLAAEVATDSEISVTFT